MDLDLQHAETGSPERAGRDGDARPQCVAVSLLLPGTVLTLRTQNSRYRVVVLDGDRGRVLVSGGVCFRDETEALLAGAGEQGDKAGWIVQGLRLELWTGRGRVVTSPIESVTVDS